MKKSFLLSLSFCVLTLIIFSCVPAKQLENAKADYNRSIEENNKIIKENENLTSSNAELESLVSKLRKENSVLGEDLSIKDKAYKTLTTNYDKINELYMQLIETQEKLKKDADADATRAMQMLQITRDELITKENELRELEKRLNLEKANLEDLSIQLGLKEKEITEKSDKVKELEDKLNAQQKAMAALKQNILNALQGFEGDGLTVYTKDNNVYVSMEEKLLFKSGKWDVDPKGIEALKKLATAIENNPDINIMIEGHTDNLAYNGSGNIQDNWDLSVKRATSIVKILLANSKINPINLTPAGKSSYVPIDNANTAEARAKNRRIEIVLSPRLNTLFDIINQ